MSIASSTSRLLALALLLTASVAVAAPGAATPPPPASDKKPIIVERVVAVVNDAIILQSELDAHLVPVVAEAEQIADPRERQRRIEKLTGQTLEEMVTEELIVQAAGEAKIDVDDAEIDATIKDIREQNNLDEKTFAQAVAQQGFTMSAYRVDLKRQLLRLHAVNQFVRAKVTITDEDIKARYDQMQRRSEAVSAVRLSQILFKLPEHPTEQDIAAARNKAAEAMQRIKNGEAFADVAKQVSEDESTKAGGGELGWFERGSMSAEWENVVFGMDKGEVRGPIKGPQGLHVFTVTEAKKGEIKPYDQLKEELRNELTRREIEKQTQVWIDDLRKKAYIDIKI